MIEKPRSSLVLICMLSCLIAACKKEETPASTPAPAPRPAKAAPKATAPAVQNQVSSAKVAQATENAVDFSKKKDPFKPYAPPPPLPAATQPSPVAGVRPQKIRRGDVLPIQSFEVTRFRVSGIIVGLKENTALIIDPNGKGYVVKQGMQIGNNDGYISRITPTAIEVVETFREDTGRSSKRTVRLTLPQKK